MPDPATERRIALLVEHLGLKEHPEGGFYHETHRDRGRIAKEHLPAIFSGPRNFSTSIYFLLTSVNFSAFHKVAQDETWYFHEGSALHIHEIDEEGQYKRTTLGLDIVLGEIPQYTVKGGRWFASSVSIDDGYSFVGCNVAPGFDFDDFVLADREELLHAYPGHQKLIRRFTR